MCVCVCVCMCVCVCVYERECVCVVCEVASKCCVTSCPALIPVSSLLVLFSNMSSKQLMVDSGTQMRVVV